MTIAPHPADIRDIVRRTFQEIGAVVDSLDDIRETILLGSGACMARTYLVDGYQAIWLLDEGVVQFTDVAGALLRIVNLCEEIPPVQLAA